LHRLGCQNELRNLGGIHRVLQECFNPLPIDAVWEGYVPPAEGATEGNPEYRPVDAEIIRSLQSPGLAV
jgi:hypothetical protein